MKGEICTIHQRLVDGHPVTAGTELRLPSGDVVPGVVAIRIEAVAGTDMWETTVKLHARVGEPVED